MSKPFQRVGAISNAHEGRQFEEWVQAYFAANGIQLTSGIGVDVGVGALKKRHAFDLGCETALILVECKAHRWTAGGNVPSAKMTVWNEAMYYFLTAPDGYRKQLYVLRDCRYGDGETLADYYVRNFGHLIPDQVEIWEADPGEHLVRRVWPI